MKIEYIGVGLLLLAYMSELRKILIVKTSISISLERIGIMIVYHCLLLWHYIRLGDSFSYMMFGMGLLYYIVLVVFTFIYRK